MSQKLALLAERRQRLVLKAAAQRALLAQNLAPLREPIATFDRGLQVFRYFKRHPVLMLGATTLISTIKLDRLSRWLKTSLSVLHLARSVTSLLLKNSINQK